MNLENNESVNLDNTLENNGDNLENNDDNLDTLEINNLIDVTNNIKNDEVGTIKLKQPKEVYLKLYYTTKQKADKYKIEALKAYMSAKNIRKKYMLDSLIESNDISMDIN